MKVTGADAVVMGEGEKPFLNLVKALETNASLHNVKGLAFKDDNRYVINERDEPIKDLDTISHFRIMTFYQWNIMSMQKFSR